MFGCNSEIKGKTKQKQIPNIWLSDENTELAKRKIYLTVDSNLLDLHGFEL